MNSTKAADVRDAINGLPCVAHDPEVSPNYPGSEKLRVTMHGPDAYHTGECVDLRDYAFLPARINEAGQIGFGKDPDMRPCYEVLVEPLAVPTRPAPTISIPPAMVHEIAKFNCRVRVTSGYRGDRKPGVIRVRDDLAHDMDPDRNGDRCPSCKATRFKLRDGVPECERCGERLEETATTEQSTLTAQR